VNEPSKWDINLAQKSDILIKCQKEHNLEGCEKCSELLDCETRLEYVKSVYESMSKGDGGGFEF
jgi:hypothetical protein